MTTVLSPGQGKFGILPAGSRVTCGICKALLRIEENEIFRQKRRSNGQYVKGWYVRCAECFGLVLAKRD